MLTVQTLQRKQLEAVRRLQQEIMEVKADYAQQLKQAKQYGGFCDLYEAARLLQVSRQRIATLIQKGRIRRVDARHLSLGDIKKYQRSPRKPGRPRGQKW